MNHQKNFKRITLIELSTLAVIFVMCSITLENTQANSLFNPALNYGAGDRPQAVAIDDLDGDTDPDLAVANMHSDNVSVLLGNGDGSFQSAVIYCSLCWPLSVDDLVTTTDPVPIVAIVDSIAPDGTAPAIVWTQNFGGPSYEEARSVIETADGSLIVAGWSNSVHNKEDVYVVKTDSNGNLIWENTYGTGIQERAYAIRETADGFVIAGRATSLETPPKEHALLLKIDINGQLIWKKLFGNDQASGARDVQVTSDGGYVIAGWTSTKRHTNASDIYVVKTNQDGDVEWEQRYQRALWQAAHNILQNSNNGYVISGIECPSAGARLNGYVMGIDSSGAFIWDRTDGGNEWDEWHGIAHAIDSGFVLSGGTKLSGSMRRAWIMKIDPMGHMTWKNELMGTYAYSWTIVQGHDGGYVFTGESADLCDGYVVKVDESGEYIWGATLGSEDEYCDCLRSLVATSDGGYVLVGYVGKEQGARPTSGYQPDWDRDLWLVKITIQRLFVDVPPGYWAEKAIYKILDAGITKGCSQKPLKYCPENTVTRSQIAVLLGRGIHGSSFTPPPAIGIFDDVPVTHWAAAWIEQFYKDGITKGCKQTPPLMYCPKNPVTRAQVAIFLLRSKHDSNYKPPPATGIFDDVPITHWAADWIEQLYKEGITKGCQKNPLRYCPESSVTRAQMAVFIVRTFDL